MALTKITKGMSNAADIIDGNFSYLVDNSLSHKGGIPSGGDFNNYLETGVYHCDGIGTEANHPGTGFGTLLVFGGPYTVQMFFLGSNKLFTRIFAQSWTPWALK